MRETFDITNQDLDDLFEKYRRAPDSYVFVILADACRKIQRTEEALEICEAGVERHPGYASGYVVKGKCLYDLGRFDAARDAFKKVLEFDEHNLVALKFLGTPLPRAHPAARSRRQGNQEHATRAHGRGKGRSGRRGDGRADPRG